MKEFKVFLDTNVLIYLTFEDFDIEKNRLANIQFQEFCNNNYIFYISAQIIREFIAIATNDKILHSPMNTDGILLKINEFQSDFNILFDTQESMEELKNIITRYNIRKHKIHDANIAATVIVNQIDYLWTFNKKDFGMIKEIQLI